jgi:hypothetical protein
VAETGEKSALRRYIALGVSVGLLIVVGGCSADRAMFRAHWNWWSKGRAQPTSATPATQAAPPDALVGPDGACAGDAGEPRAIALGMTECELIHTAGATGQVNVGTNERGERAVVVTYASGDHAGVYRFVSGRLISIEGAPQPEKPPPRKKKRGKPKQASQR